MSYQEKRTTANIFSGLLVLAAYCIYAFNRAGAAPAGDLKFWASTMLIFIGIGIAATIVIQIVFNILFSISMAVEEKIQDQGRDSQDIEKRIKSEIHEDERDKLVELKAMRIGFAIAGTGFVAALVALVFNASPVVMLNVMFISFMLGSLCEGAGQIYYYRKGV